MIIRCQLGGEIINALHAWDVSYKTKMDLFGGRAETGHRTFLSRRAARLGQFFSPASPISALAGVWELDISVCVCVCVCVCVSIVYVVQNFSCLIKTNAYL